MWKKNGNRDQENVFPNGLKNFLFSNCYLPIACCRMFRKYKFTSFLVVSWDPGYLIVTNAMTIEIQNELSTEKE